MKRVRVLLPVRDATTHAPATASAGLCTAAQVQRRSLPLRSVRLPRFQCRCTRLAAGLSHRATFRDLSPHPQPQERVSLGSLI